MSQFSQKGIHHITAVGSDPVKTIKFYSQILGLRLVKRTVNQDQVEAYHLFFGDRMGEPGMDLTFFTFPGATRGVVGVGQVSLISLAVPAKSLPFWQKRLSDHHVDHEEITTRDGLDRLPLKDFDGLKLELVGLKPEELKSMTGNVWTSKDITKNQAIRCFYSARLAVAYEGIMGLVLTHGLGYIKQGSDGRLSGYALAGKHRARSLEVEEMGQAHDSRSGAGTVHHIAFTVADEAALIGLSNQLRELGLSTTEVIDRYYFKSIYFRTPSGILFELATDGPGFTTDEPEESLGERLSLPPFLESRREQIEAQLVPLP